MKKIEYNNIKNNLNRPMRERPVSINKLTIILLVTLIFAISITSTARAKIVDRIVAVVNGEPITMYELEQQAAPTLAQYLKGIKDPKKIAVKRHEILSKILPSMIDQTLVDQEVKKRHLKVTPAEVNATIQSIMAKNHLNLKEFKKVLHDSGTNIAAYKKEISHELLRLQLIQSEVKSKIVITDEQVDNYLKTHPKLLKHIPSGPEYMLQYICITPKDPTDPKSVQKAKLQIKKAYKELLSGMAFDKVLKKYGGNMCKQDNGMLGTFTLTDLAPTIRNAVAKLKPGEITPILKTKAGWEIFRLKKIIDKKKQMLTAEKERIRQLLYKKELDSKFQAWLQQLRNKSSIRILL